MKVGTLLRYSMLTALAVLSLYAVLVTGDNSARVLLAQSAAGKPQDCGLYGLAGIAALSALSLFRFVLHGAPSMLSDWFSGHRDWLVTLFLGCLVVLVVRWL